MKRCRILCAAVVCLGSVLVAASRPLAQSRAKAQNVPEIPYDSVPNFFKMPPNIYFGEGIGVATNSRGHVFVYTRSGETRLFEFDEKGTFVRELGQGLYGFVFAHAVRVDKNDNVWAVDEGSNIGTPAAICISAGSHQYLYSSNSNETETLDNGEIYKLELDGRIVGKFGRAGKLPKEFGIVNAIDCRNETNCSSASLETGACRRLRCGQAADDKQLFTKRRSKHEDKKTKILCVSNSYSS
jgi:hypothetical protein